MSESEQTLRLRFARFQRAGIVVAAVGLLLCAVGLFVQPQQFFFAWLFGYVLWTGLALGCLALLMIHHLTGGEWGFLVRRILEAGTMTLPVMAAMFVPLFFGLGRLYSWAQPEVVAHDAVLQRKHLYLNIPAFTGRTVVLFGFWIALTLLLNRRSLEQDTTSDPAPTRSMRKVSGPGLVLFTLAGTLAGVDWIMVLENDWYSSIFPVQLMIGQMLGTMTLCIGMLAWLRRYDPLRQVVRIEHLHKFGNLLLAFVMLWAYMAVSQLIIIWSGNLPREISWYLHRIAGGWKGVAIGIGLFYFFVPFFLLLSRQNKQNIRALCTIAGGVFFMHVVEIFWFVAPSLHRTGFSVSWLDAAALAGIGGVWTAAFFGHLKSVPLLPKNDPRMPAAFAHGN